MKKILLVVLCAVLALSLVACGGENEPEPTFNEAETTETVEASAEPIEEASIEPTPEPTGTAEPYILDQPERMKSYAYEVSSLWRKEADVNNIWYYKTDNNEEGGLQVNYTVMAVVDITDESIATPLIDDTITNISMNKGVSNMSSGNIVSIAGNPAKQFECDWAMNGINNPTKGLVAVDSTGICIFVIIEPEDSDGSLIATFPAIVESIDVYEAEDDFLKDEEMRGQVNNLKNGFRFEELVELADAYIAENSPAESDSVYTIKSAAEEAAVVMPNCTVVVDDFENESILYGSVDSISSDINFVPFIGDGSPTFDMKAKVGFKQSGWLFMDSVKIKVSEDDYIFDTLSGGIQEVLSGGTILEEDVMELKYEEVDQILNAESPVMRFEGEDDKTRDHSMTSAEIESLRNVSVVAKCLDSITSAMQQWVEANVY